MWSNWEGNAEKLGIGVVADIGVLVWPVNAFVVGRALGFERSWEVIKLF